MNFCEFEEYKDKTNISKIKKILLNKRSSQMPTVINNVNDNQVWLFFFKEKFLKSLWIFDGKQNKWFNQNVLKDVTAVCFYDNNIYVSDRKGKIYLKKTGSKFPSC